MSEELANFLLDIGLSSKESDIARHETFSILRVYIGEFDYGYIFEKIFDFFENLDEDTSLNLLYTKWIAPLVNGLDELGKNVLVELEEKIRALHKKYAKTFVEIEEALNSSQKEFINRSSKLRGSEKDLAGIRELQKLLGVQNEK